jgi:DNA end-binding protein Ku
MFFRTVPQCSGPHIRAMNRSARSRVDPQIKESPMASRAVWKGQLRLSLVSIPVEIHSATKSGARVSFRQIHKPSGQRVRYEKTVPGVGPVKSDDIFKGYELGDDEYLLLEPDEIDAIKLETKKTLELVQFVGSCEIPPLYFDKPYYVVPSDDLAEDAYRVVRDALRAEEKVGLGQLTMRGKEHLCAIKPCGDGLLLETLLYADELKDADPMFSQIEDDAADKELLSVASELVARKTAPFDAKSFNDRYDIALRDLIESKRKNRKTPRARASGDDRSGGGGENVVDLMAALKESLKKDAPKKGTRKSAPRKKTG